MTMIRSVKHMMCLTVLAVVHVVHAFSSFVPSSSWRRRSFGIVASNEIKTFAAVNSEQQEQGGDGTVDNVDVLSAAIDAMYGGGSELREEPAVTRARIQELVDNNAVLLFMKGSKFFPQCGFSDTATKILDTFPGLEYETVDVLEDDTIREGIKVYSQWPTIPQLYVNGEFIGGSDIMMEMYQDGSLKEMINDIQQQH